VQHRLPLEGKLAKPKVLTDEVDAFPMHRRGGLSKIAEPYETLGAFKSQLI